jgi:hypothetical protein
MVSGLAKPSNQLLLNFLPPIPWIKTFDGSQANLRNWLNEVEKFSYINRIDDNATTLIAYQSAGGKCSEFLQRVFQEYPRDSWEEIKEQLIARFGETTDHRQAFFILRNRRNNSTFLR